MKNLVKKVRDRFWYVMVAGAIVDVIFNKLCTGWLYIVLLIVGLGALIWGDYLQHGRKLFDMTKDEVSRSINMGEALMNVLASSCTSSLPDGNFYVCKLGMARIA